MRKGFIIVMGCWLAAVAINYWNRTAYPLTFKEEIRFAPQKEVVDILCLDHQGLAADLLFIQTVLHSGSLMWKPLEYEFDSRWSYRIMDLVTTLDHRYLTAYLFSGMGLVHGPRDVRLARPILERGRKYFPENWELPFWLGYLQYVYLEDYKAAGEYFWQAFQCPNAPKGFLSLMLSSLKKGGSYERALIVLKRLIENTDNEKIVRIYQKRMVRLKNMMALQEKAAQYRSVKGTFPEDLGQLVMEKLIPGIPEDPMGKNYQWDPINRRVIIAD